MHFHLTVVLSLTEIICYCGDNWMEQNCKYIFIENKSVPSKEIISYIVHRNHLLIFVFGFCFLKTCYLHILDEANILN
ncbi:hypothetical protein RchiOBHm_Chr7g0199971 [Rosa chinensis]|uniref:Uncharacterized protein n=1 Tax=Rosa chinensis TaxID=74649 RepID=A0A2P6P7I8_ROSCH|nr:hypothetical protein RchiOBHm_Chr7g0199971 [Rosa chinensis]